MVNTTVRGRTMAGQFSVLAPDHDNLDCTCSHNAERNNMYATAFCDICIDRGHKPRRPKTDGFQAPAEAVKTDTMLNTSLVFEGEVKIGGLASRYMICRQTLADLRRRIPIYWKQICAEMNLYDHPAIMRGIMAQLNRPEYEIKVRRLTEDFGDQVELGEAEARFHRREQQMACIDVIIRAFRSQYGIDLSLNNAVFTSPNNGLRLCIFCSERIMVKTMACLLKHLDKKHRKLIKSWFTCPGCLIVMVEIGRAHV